MLLYRGLVPGNMPLDTNIAAFQSQPSYPTKYGYSLVGRVTGTGKSIDPGWMGRTVFSFHPHESHFVAGAEELLPVPVDVTPEEAVFLPNMETAVNLVMDGAPLIGEDVAVLGQGIVGLLTTALLGRFPLGRLLTLDRFLLRRQISMELGAHASFDPGEIERLKSLVGVGLDLCFELSGSPEALDQAIALTGYSGRVVIGSWYGTKAASLDLGGRFHRSRIRLLSSQVSSISPELTGRWTKERRYSVAWEMLKSISPERLITHKIPLTNAEQAFHLIDQDPAQTVQVVLTYEDK
jgi:threonine dehydrogenase-like Zn-dependent dehydrogenase